MRVKLFSSDEADAALRVFVNNKNVYLLPHEINPSEIRSLTSEFEVENEECHVRFAREIEYPCKVTFNDGREVHSLSETLSGISADDENNPSEIVSLIVPDDAEKKFIDELCRQFFLLQIPFEIQTQSFQKFSENRDQLLKELNVVEKIFNASDVEKIISQSNWAALKKNIASFKSYLEKNNVSPALASNVQNLSMKGSSLEGYIFVLDKPKPDLSPLKKFKAENILFVATEKIGGNAKLNVPLILAQVLEYLNQKGFDKSNVTFSRAENLNLSAGILKSFRDILATEMIDCGKLNKFLGDFNENFLQCENDFVSNHFIKHLSAVREKNLQAESSAPKIQRLIEHKNLLFGELAIKALLYDSQQYAEKFWYPFEKKCRETFNEIATSIYLSQNLYDVYAGQLPPALKKFLAEKDALLNKEYENMLGALELGVQIFLENRTRELITLFFSAEFGDKLNDFQAQVGTKFILKKTRSPVALSEILSAEKLLPLVRCNSRVFSLNNFAEMTEKPSEDDLIFLEANFQRDLSRLLELEFHERATSEKNRLTWEISSGVSKYWSKISDALNKKIEATKSEFRNSIRETDAEREQLKSEWEKYSAFFKHVWKTTKTLWALM